MITIQVARAKRPAAPFDALRRAQEKAARDALMHGARVVRDEMRATLSEADQGRPSRAGAPPHLQSGRLRASVFARIDPSKLSAEVGTELAYGAYLEFGTLRMAARPWLSPAFDASKPTVCRLIAEAVRASVAKRTRAQVIS